MLPTIINLVFRSINRQCDPIWCPDSERSRYIIVQPISCLERVFGLSIMYSLFLRNQWRVLMQYYWILDLIWILYQWTVWFYYAGFTGRKCEKDPCSSAPCLNGGSCMSMALNGSTTFHCACPEGWNGAHCDISAVEGACASNPCVNGICIEHTDDQIEGEKFRCFCQPGK